MATRRFLAPILTVLLVGLIGFAARAQEPIAIYRHFPQTSGPVNSFLVETERGIVLIGAQARLSEARTVLQTIDALGKPLTAVIITHAHPDQYAGLPVVLERFPKVPVYATEETTEEMAFDSDGLMAAFRAAIPDDTPEFVPQPNRRVDHRDVLEFDRVRFSFLRIPGGRPSDPILIHLPDSNRLFTANIVSPGTVPQIARRRLDSWLTQIARLQSDFAGTAPMTFPAHGRPGAFTDLVRDQMSRLLILRHVAVDRRDDMRVAPAAIADIVRDYRLLFPEPALGPGAQALFTADIEALATQRP